MSSMSTTAFFNLVDIVDAHFTAFFTTPVFNQIFCFICFDVFWKPILLQSWKLVLFSTRYVLHMAEFYEKMIIPSEDAYPSAIGLKFFRYVTPKIVQVTKKALINVEGVKLACLVLFHLKQAYLLTQS